MNRFLKVFNFVGICSMAALCGAQWRENRRANLSAVQLEATRLIQVAQLADRDKTIRGQAVDLDELRQRLVISEAAEKDLERKLVALTLVQNQIKADRDRLAVQTEQLKISLGQWMAAVTERDIAIKKAGESIQKIATERNDAIVRFNDLQRSTTLKSPANDPSK